MLAEELKNLLAAAGIDFIVGGSRKREIYLYPEDVLADDVTPLSVGQVIKVTFEYADAPTVSPELRLHSMVVTNEFKEAQCQ